MGESARSDIEPNCGAERNKDILQRMRFWELKEGALVFQEWAPATTGQFQRRDSPASRWVQRCFFQYLSTTFNVNILHNMAFNSYAAVEARISEACDAIHDGWYTNCVQAASAYEVPLRRLQRRWNGGVSKSTKASTNKALTEGQEGAIREYIDRLDKINMCARPQMIVGAAKLPH